MKLDLKKLEEDLMARSAKMLQGTAPVYRLDERGRRELFGSGVLFRYDSQHFVLSAGHVLTELRDRPLSIGGETKNMPLTGPFFHTGPVGETSFENEPFDFAFVPLSQEQVSALSGTLFLTLDNIEPAGSSTEGARYNALGFIAKDHRVLGGGELLAEATAIVAMPAPAEKYAERGVSQDSHLLLSFDRFKTHSAEGQMVTPKINGMSGCGIWRLGTPDTLSAILTEHHQENKKFIVATRISAVIPGLAEYAAGNLSRPEPKSAADGDSSSGPFGRVC